MKLSKVYVYDYHDESLFLEGEKISNHSIVLFAMVIFSDIYMKTMRIVSIDLRLSMRVNRLEYKRIFSLVNSRIPALEREDGTS